MPSLVLRLGLGFAWGFLGLSEVGVRFSMVLSLCRVFVGAGVLSLGVCLSSVPLASSKYPHTWNGVSWKKLFHLPLFPLFMYFCFCSTIGILVWGCSFFGIP